MIEWFSTAVASANAVKDISQSLVTLRDEEKIRGRVFDLTSALMELQQQLMNAQVAQMALVDEIRELKNRLADTTQQADGLARYKLHKFPTGAFAYVLKPEFTSDEPPHFLCSKCFENKLRITLHQVRGGTFRCPECKQLITAAR